MMVRLRTRLGDVFVTAEVYGDWAVHRVRDVEHDSRRGWRVSHVPTGMAIRSLVDDMAKTEAIRVARAMSDLDVHDTDAKYIAQAIAAKALMERAA